MKFEIRNRRTGDRQFDCELSAAYDSAPYGVRLGAAVQIAYESGADLRFADLSGVDLSGADLRDAVLRGANLSGASLRDTDLIGADLRGASLSRAVLSGADLRGASLRAADLDGADLRFADLSGVDLRDANLRRAVLRDAVLRGADLRDTDLIGADLRGVDLSDVPAISNIHQQVYAAASAEGALDMSTWHRCETTHCRAGWVVRLAGDAGAALEYCIGTGAAAALIYIKSDPTLERIPDFYASNADALADMKRLAEAEAAK